MNVKLTYHCISIRFEHLPIQSISDRTGLIPVSSHVGMGRFLLTATLMEKKKKKVVHVSSYIYLSRYWGFEECSGFLSCSLDKLLPPFLNSTLIMANGFLKDITFPCSFLFLWCWRSMLLIVAGTWTVLTLHKVLKALSMQLLVLVSFMHAF